jgi:hypothetical protein
MDPKTAQDHCRSTVAPLWDPPWLQSHPKSCPSAHVDSFLCYFELSQAKIWMILNYFKLFADRCWTMCDWRSIVFKVVCGHFCLQLWVQIRCQPYTIANTIYCSMYALNCFWLSRFGIIFGPRLGNCWFILKRLQGMRAEREGCFRFYLIVSVRLPASFPLYVMGLRPSVSVSLSLDLCR